MSKSKQIQQNPNRSTCLFFVRHVLVVRYKLYGEQQWERNLTKHHTNIIAHSSCCTHLNKILATLIKQQQQRGHSSNPVRASTVRPFGGGGVIGDATTITTSATSGTATNLTTATTTTTTNTAVVHLVEDDGARRHRVEELRRQKSDHVRAVWTDTCPCACVSLSARISVTLL